MVLRMAHWDHVPLDWNGCCVRHVVVVVVVGGGRHGGGCGTLCVSSHTSTKQLGTLTHVEDQFILLDRPCRTTMVRHPLVHVVLHTFQNGPGHIELSVVDVTIGHLDKTGIVQDLILQ